MEPPSKGLLQHFPTSSGPNWRVVGELKHCGHNLSTANLRLHPYCKKYELSANSSVCLIMRCKEWSCAFFSFRAFILAGRSASINSGLSESSPRVSSFCQQSESREHARNKFNSSVQTCLYLRSQCQICRCSLRKKCILSNGHLITSNMG